MPLVVERTTTVDPDTKPYRPRGVLTELFATRDREIVVEGPADTGKSRACLEKLHAAMMKYPRARAALIRKTRASLTDTACATYERFVRPDGASRLWGDREYRYGNGSKIVLIGMDDPAKILSGEYDLAYIQEVSELAEEDYEIITTRVTGRGAVMPYTQVIADLNPMHPDFWLYEREKTGKARFLQARHADNPSMTPERLSALDTLTGYRYKRLRLGLRVAAEGMYFEEWNPETHVVPAFDVPKDWPRWLGVDYGYAAPWCCLWFTRDPETRRIYVYREAYAAGLRDEEQARTICDLSAGERLRVGYGDPSMFNQRKEVGLPSIATAYLAKGLPLVPASNNRHQGWAACRRALAVDLETGAPRFGIMAGRAPNLVRTIPAMVHDALDPEDLADVVNGRKTEDHPPDAWRYGISGVGAAPGARPVAVSFESGT